MALLSTIPRPFVVGVIVEDDADGVPAAIARAAADGCQAVEVNLAALPEPGSVPWTHEDAIGSGVAVYTSARRRAFMAAYGLDADRLVPLDDEGRMRWQLELISRGSVAIDMELDAFAPDPSPTPGSEAAVALATTSGPAREVARDPLAISRQRAAIAEAHDRGGEVIVSCHTGTRQDRDDLVAIVATATERGADLVKVVTPCPEVDDLLELLAATARLCELCSVPFTLAGSERCGSLSRFVGPHLGSGWTFARDTGSRFGFAGQPTAEELHRVFAAARWRYGDVLR